MTKIWSITCLIILSILVFGRPSPGSSDSSGLSGTDSRIYFGEVKQMGNGMVWSWVRTDAMGNPSSLGVTFTETALSGLPENPSAQNEFPTTEYELSLPNAVSVPPYTHIVVNWNPRGHIPPGIYDVPHFDFHFYIIPPADRYKITARGDDIAKSNKKMTAEHIPAGYILPDGTQEPRMGSHWVDPSSPEFNKQPFTRTFLYGSYDGELTFMEPMASVAFFATKPNITDKIKLPASYKKRGFYPTAWRIKYDSARREYSVSLESLIYR